MSHQHDPTHTLGHFTIFSSANGPTNQHVLGVWEETGAPGENSAGFLTHPKDVRVCAFIGPLWKLRTGVNRWSERTRWDNVTVSTLSISDYSQGNLWGWPDVRRASPLVNLQSSAANFRQGRCMWSPPLPAHHWPPNPHWFTGLLLNV